VQLLSYCGAFLSSSNILIENRQKSDSMTNNEWQTYGEQVNTIVEIIKTVIKNGSAAGGNVLKWSVSCLAIGTSTTVNDNFNLTYVDILSLLSDSDRCYFLGLSDKTHYLNLNLNLNEITASRASTPNPFKSHPLPMSSTTGIPFILSPITKRWDDLNICKTISKFLNVSDFDEESNKSNITSIEDNNFIEFKSNENRDKLTLTQIQIIYICYYNALEHAKRFGERLDNVLNGEWLDLYHSLSNFIYVALCDPLCSSYAAGILSMMLFYSSLRDEIINDPRLLGANTFESPQLFNLITLIYSGTIRLLYPQAPSSAGSAGGNAAMRQENMRKNQENFESFLMLAFQAGHPFHISCQTLLRTFSKKFPLQFDKYENLTKLLKEFDHMLH
jgi:hypothetical protein